MRKGSTSRSGDENRARMLKFVRDYYLEHRYPPTISEIKDGVGLASKSTVIYFLDGLIGLGLIERQVAVARSTLIVDDNNALEYINRHLGSGSDEPFGPTTSRADRLREEVYQRGDELPGRRTR